MADGDDKKEAVVKSYMILQRNSMDELEKIVNKHINAEDAKKKYIPYGPMIVNDGVYIQVMTLASLATLRVTGGVGVSSSQGTSVTVNTGTAGQVAITNANGALKVQES